MGAKRIPRDRWLEGFEKHIDSLKKSGDREHRKTYDEVFDRRALVNIYKLFSRRIISTVEHPISTGKEANIFKATDREGDDVVLKIFRESTSTFKHFLKYIEGDPRFEKTGRGRKTISLWAQKEYKNLMRLDAAGVTVPKALAFQQNMVVMEYIGDRYSSAPRLKDCLGSNLDYDKIFQEIMENLDKMVREANVVHADLSEYNILLRPELEKYPYFELCTGQRGQMEISPGRDEVNDDETGNESDAAGETREEVMDGDEAHEEVMDGDEAHEEAMDGDEAHEPISATPVIIDLGQATLLEHPMASEFLERDVRNIVRFFVKNRLLSTPIEEKEFIKEKLGSYSSLLNR